jgi:uncharacterized protein YdhG (YjbR/CyaY superfamily)
MTVIDDYLKNVDPIQRTELERIRSIALEMLPGAQEVISYGMPTIKYKGKSIVGFDARSTFIGIYPFSGHVIKGIEELDGYATSTGAVREKSDDLLPKELIQKIIKLRLEQAFS